jgi:hypothetical protein
LTFEQRQILRAELDRRRRAALEEESRRQVALDAQLAEEFRNEELRAWWERNA